MSTRFFTNHDSKTLIEKFRGVFSSNAPIYRGVVTGLNEAFIIDGAKRRELIADSPGVKDIIKPYLGGRNVRKWACDYPDLWMLYLPHGINTHGLEPVINHLRPFRQQLEARATKQEWYELQQPQEKFIPAYEAPKIIFPDIAIDLRFALDTKGAFFSNTAYCIASADLYLLAILNSSCTQFFYEHLSTQIRGGYLRFFTQYVEKIPIPEATDNEKTKLGNLAIRAAKAAGSELAAIEVEINKIVYRLFDLTPDEIALIEGATKASKPTLDHKSALFTRILPELKQVAPYFSIDAVKNRLKQLNIEISESTLNHYMSDAMEQGVVYDAGRGWYSRLADEFKLDTKPVSGVIQRLDKKFPLLDFTCWSTRQINSFMHHLLTKFVTFVYTDKDSMSSVYDEIQTWNGYTVYLDPSSKEVAKTFQLDDKTIVIRPVTTEAPGKGEDHPALIEKLLVDLAIEVGKLPLMDSGEFQDMAGKIATSGRIRFGMLVRYAGRSHKNLEDVFGENSTVMAQSEQKCR